MTMIMEPVWLRNARKDIGLKEYRGKENNPLVVRLFAKIHMSGIKDDETPWCAAFVGAKLEEVGIRSTRSASALSYLDWGISVEPCIGAVCVKRRFNSAGKIIGGHVFFAAGLTDYGKVYGLGGNQDDQVSIVPYDPHVIVDYRWPSSVTIPRAPLPVLKMDVAGAASEA